MTKVPKQSRTSVPQYLNGITHRNMLGLTQHNIQLIGPQWFQHQYSKFSWINKAKAKVSVKGYNKSLSTLMISDYNANRMSFIVDAIDYCHPQIKAVFKTLAQPHAYPIQILDKYGKVQTGLIICLVLLLLGIDEESIVQDHLKSDQGLAPMKDEMTLMMVKFGFPVSEKTMSCSATFVKTIREHLETKFGGIGAYLLKIGLIRDELQILKSISSTEDVELEKKRLAGRYLNCLECVEAKGNPHFLLLITVGMIYIQPSPACCRQ